MESWKKYGIFIFLWIWLCLFLFGQNQESKLIFKSPKPYMYEKSSVENEQDVKNQTKNSSNFDEQNFNEKVTSVKLNEEKTSKSFELDVNTYV
jgi:hypothetical protein